MHDLPFVIVTLLNGALSVQYVLLDVAVPLWVVHDTRAPAWTVAALFLINTLMIISFQVRASRGTELLPTARRAIRRGGWAFGVGALMFAAAHWMTTGLVMAVLVLAVLAHTIGELWHAAATFGISFELAPAHAQGQYQGLFNMGMGLARTIGPAFVTLLTITWGPPGWIVVAVYLVLVSRALSTAVAQADNSVSILRVPQTPRGAVAATRHRDGCTARQGKPATVDTPDCYCRVSPLVPAPSTRG